MFSLGARWQQPQRLLSWPAHIKGMTEPAIECRPPDRFNECLLVRASSRRIGHDAERGHYRRTRRRRDCDRSLRPVQGSRTRSCRERPPPGMRPCAFPPPAGKARSTSRTPPPSQAGSQISSSGGTAPTPSLDRSSGTGPARVLHSPIGATLTHRTSWSIRAILSSGCACLRLGRRRVSPGGDPMPLARVSTAWRRRAETASFRHHSRRTSCPPPWRTSLSMDLMRL